MSQFVFDVQMPIIATCATLAGIIAAARGGESITLRDQACSAVVISARPPRAVIISANGSVIAGLSVRGATNIQWLGGTIRSSGGTVPGPQGYGLRIYAGAQNIAFEGVIFTASNRAVVIDEAARIKLKGNRFWRVGQDGIIASRTDGLLVQNNSFAETVGKPSSCSKLSAVQYGLPRKDCQAIGGVWSDGYHPDAVQMRNGVKNALLIGNIVSGGTQGLTQMGTTGDLPLEHIIVRKNTLRTSMGHAITLGECIECRIMENDVRRGLASTVKAVIIPGRADSCGNIAPDMKRFDPNVMPC